MELIKPVLGIFLVLAGFLIILFHDKIVLDFFAIRKGLMRKFTIIKIIGLCLVLAGFIIALN